ncbi:MAG TPA: hypothetical protein VF855_11755 [Acidimicrobiales bacterium]
MAWDSSRQVPWRQLVVPFLVYAAVVNALFAVLGRWDPAVVAGTAMGGLFYVIVSTVLVKFGWNPPTFKRRPAPAAPRGAGGGTAGTPTAAPRPAPTPTKRTNAGNPKARKSR